MLDHVVSVVVIQTTRFSYLLTTTLTTLPLGNNIPQRQGDNKHYFSPCRVAVLLPHEMLLNRVVSVVVIQATRFSYLLTTTLTILPLGNNIPQRQGDIKHYFSPCRVAVLLPHEMLLDYVVYVVVYIVFFGVI